MRKKYLSALLFGALLMASTATFTSCKDYDDDINDLQSQITDVKNAVAELQKQIGNGKFVTDVTADGKGLKITWNDASTTTIENVVNGDETASAGDVITFDATTGEIKINDKGTGYYASKTQSGTFKAPYVNDNGALVLIDAEGKEVVTNILTAPVTAVENADHSYTLTIFANGSKQEVVIPSAASSMTDLDIIGYAKVEDQVTGENFPADTDKENGFYTPADGYVSVHAYKPTATTDWKGNKPNLTGKEVLAAYKMNGLVARVAPLAVDASSVEFTLVNTKSETAPVTISMSPYSNNAAITRAASKNGLYSVAFDYQDVTSDKTAANWAEEVYGANTASKLFALKSEAGTVSSFDVAVLYNATAQKITEFNLTDGETLTQVVDVTTNTSTQIDISKGTTYTVTSNDDSFIYDAYLVFKENDIDKWGISYDKANAPMSFTVADMPDPLSAKEFTFTVKYLTKDGTIQTDQNITVKPKTNLNDATQLCAEVTHPIVKKEEGNFFTVSLDEMFNALGASKTLQWKRDAILSLAEFEIKEGNKQAPNSGKADFDMTFTEDAEGKKKTTDAAKAKYVKFDIANGTGHLTPGTSYVATITFKSQTGTSQGEYFGNEINKVTVPLKITIPAFTDLFEKDMNVFDAEGKVASAYLLEAYETAADGRAFTTFKFRGAFKNFEANAKKGFAYTMTLDDETEVVGTKMSDDVAFLAASNYKGSQTISVAVNETTAANAAITLKDTERANAYGKELIVNVTTPTYCGVYEYDNTSFKIKVLSPIKEGKYVAEGGAVKIAATGTTTVTAEDVWATTVNDNVKYDLFKTGVKGSDGKYTSKWARLDIQDVVFSSDRIKFVVENDGGKPTEAIVNNNTGAITTPSSISLRSSANKGDTSKLTIKVTDIWGYTLEKDVDVVVE